MTLRCLVLVIALWLTGCALSPNVLREKLDACDRYRFDSLVYRRASDGAVTRVLCVPKEEEMDHQFEHPALIPMLIKRALPLLNQRQ